MKLSIIPYVFLLMIYSCNCVAHDKFDQVVLSSAKPVKLTTTADFLYIDLKLARKVCTDAKKHCAITEAELFTIHGSRKFLYRIGDYTNQIPVGKIGGLLGRLISVPLTTNVGTTASTLIKIENALGYYMAAIVWNLSIVKRVEADYAIYKFDVRVCLGYSASVADAAAVVTKIEAGGVAGDTFGVGITAPYQVITGTTVSVGVKNLAADAAVITNTCNRVSTVAAGTGQTIVLNTLFWFAAASDLLDTEVAYMTTGACA